MENSYQKLPLKNEQASHRLEKSIQCVCACMRVCDKKLLSRVYKELQLKEKDELDLKKIGKEQITDIS